MLSKKNDKEFDELQKENHKLKKVRNNPLSS
jgi:hypothetical protein